MWEFAPPWRNPRMTKQQINKYNRERDKNKALAQAKLDEAKKNWEFDEKEDLSKLENLLDDVF